MTTEPTPLVTVLPCEADREAAKPFFNEGGPAYPLLVQAFADRAASARLAALEAAAKVAEEASGPELPWSLTEDGAQKAGRSIATAIRALSNKGGRDGE